MENFVQTLPYGSLITTAIVIVLGFAAVYYFFDKDRRSRRKEENEADERLVKILQTTVKELEGKIKSQGDKIDQLTKKVDVLEHDNDTLIKVLQGRDDNTRAFQERVIAAMSISEQTHALVTQIAESMKQSNENMVRVLTLIEKK